MGDLVMVIEDEQGIRDLLRYNLERAGFRVSAFGDGEEGLEHLFQTRHAALVLDLMLPGKNGLDVLREIRGEPSTRDLPVMLLTARAAEIDKLVGFDQGADDYVTKPFSPREVVARIQALLRRAGPGYSQGVVEVGSLRVDALAREAAWRGAPLTLTPREFDLLSYLARNPGRVASRDELLRKVWGYDYTGDPRTVDVHVRRLRVKLDTVDPPIETVKGAGYKLVAPPVDPR